MRAKVTLVARVNDGTGTFPRIPVRIARRAIVTPVEGKDRFFDQRDIIGFYARYSSEGKRHTEALGKDPIGAYTRFLQIEQDFSRVRAGLLPINEENSAGPVEEIENRTLRACAREFKQNIVTLGKKKSTIEMYSRAVDDFVGQYPNKTIDAIDKKDMLAHIALLRTKIKKRGDGDAQHTFRNRLRNLTVFFNSFGVKNPLPMRELKRPMKKRPTRYSVDMIRTMLGAANENEKDLIQFFLNTGFCDEEAAYAMWSDINFQQGSINVYAKPMFGWTPKDGEAREQDIVLGEKFIERMKARATRWGDSGLIFPTERGTPNMHLIKIVQRVAKRAGISGRRITLHDFRRTFGTVIAKEYGIEQARIWLGHSDIETTQRYMAADEMTTEQSRTKAHNAFVGFGD